MWSVGVYIVLFGIHETYVEKYLKQTPISTHSNQLF
jgi:hypothetical protein